MATTTFGKKTSAGGPAGSKPTFGKKTSQAPTRRAMPAAQSGLSPDALAFLQSERSRAPAAASATRQIPGYAAPAALTAGKPVWNRRVVASLIDALVFILPVILIITAMGPQPGITDAQFAVGYYGGIVFLVLSGVAYSIAMESSSLQATLGKLAVGAIVTDKTGGKPSLGAIILRNTVGKFLSSITPFYISYLMGLARQDRRCLHDLIGGTMVCAKGTSSQSYANTFA